MCLGKASTRFVSSRLSLPSMAMKLSDKLLTTWVQGLGFRGLGCPGCGVEGLGLRAADLRFRGLSKSIDLGLKA